MKSVYRYLPALLILLQMSTGNCQQLQRSTNEDLVVFASGLITPVCITNAGDTRLFVVDQHGLIMIIDPDGNVNPVPFLDISGRVTFGGEQGLLGLAFHPQYETNGYFYVNYVGEGDSTHISRFSVSAGNPDRADSLSEYKLMTIYQPFPNHNGGDVSFGPDGYLYIGLGDGGSSGDPDNRAQNPMELLGKMLRIDVDNGTPYSIPESNPFYDEPNARGEIWAMGLRNPWRFSFDRLTGDLWIADVGQSEEEEINFQSAASGGRENYGWRCYEGNLEYNTNDCGASSAYVFPVYTYPHGDECSITGGYVFRGSESSTLYGYYFFADYCSGRVWTLHQEDGEWIREDFGQYPDNGISSFGEDSDGQLYVAGLNSGTIFRVGGLTENQLNLSLLLEGLYEEDGLMNPANNATGAQWGAGIADHITVELHDAANYGTLVSFPDVELSINGTASVTFPASFNGSYYVSILHRNSIETVSANPISFSASITDYNFDQASKAFGSNMKLLYDGRYAIFSGDVNQDGTIDIADFIPVDNDLLNFANGYINTDTNGDGSIDIADFSLIDNNQSNFIRSILP